MFSTLLLPEGEDVAITVLADTSQIVLDLKATTSEASCPACHEVSHQVHSRYIRRPKDVPLAGRPVQWQLHVRRFRCRNRACPQQVFTERFLEDLLPSRARRTTRLTEVLRQLAFVTGGLPGSRLTAKLGMSSSASTLVRLIRAAPLPPPPPPTIIGVDEWAWRKGRTYGTLIVNMETHRVHELLPDCRSDTVADWLQQHPTITVVTRDRSGPFATAISQGAPQALQVADRFHLLQNISEVLRRVFEQHRTTLAPLRRSGIPDPTTPASENETEELPTTERQRQREGQFRMVQQLHRGGMNQVKIAQKVGICRRTVNRWLQASAPPHAPGGKGRGRPSGSQLDPYKPFLLEQYQAGCQNARRLLEEIQERGYRGSLALLRKFLTLVRNAEGRIEKPPTDARARYSTPDLFFAVVSKPDTRTPEQQALVEHIQSLTPQLDLACTLATRFTAMVRQQQAEQLPQWLDDAAGSDLAAFRTFAAGLRRDLSAVTEALRLPYSNGPTEGHVHRLKLLKRQSYGRAGFTLLRQRVLAAS
jgi:transposase